MKNEILCCDYKSLLSQIPSGTAALVLTDPPFGINYQNNFTKKLHNKIEGDEKRFSYLEFAHEAFRILRDNAAIFAFTGWSEYPIHFQEIATAGFSMKEPVICQKRPSGKTDLYGTFQSNSDWLMFGHKVVLNFVKLN